MKRTAMITALVAGVNAAIDPDTVKPWGSSGTIDVPGYRYLSFTPPLAENTETLQFTVSGWVRGMTAAETAVEAITDELHRDGWRTYRGIYCRLQFTGIRMNADEEPGVYRFDMDFEMEPAREVAGRY